MSDKKKIRILNILIIIFAILFIVSGALLAFTLINLKKSKSYYKETAKNYVKIVETNDDLDLVSIDSDASGKEADPAILKKFKDKAPINVDFNGLKSVNEDICGWIYCPDTIINYPVVKGDDNSYYLHRMLDNSVSYPGSIFMDCKGKTDFSDKNTVIYGHNMKNSTMFGTLIGYKNQDYYKEHPVIYYLTPDKNYRFDIFAAFVTRVGSISYQCNEENFSNLLTQAYETSDIHTIIDKNDIQNIVTLSTCAYDFTDARYVVQANVVEIE
ncbi:MAG: class B sortase [Lachnospiraceae bacterium]|nr:class B sortase [Lachnospiraceae bacterium]